MLGKRYIFTIVETKSNKAYSALINRSTIIIIFIIIFLIAGILTIPLTTSIHKISNTIEFTKLQKENQILRQAYDSWKERINYIENTIEELNIKNNNLMAQQFDSLPRPDIQLGVGGPESMSRVSILEYPDIKKTDKNLTKLEVEIDWLKKNMTDIEKVIARRMDRLNHYPSIKPVEKGWYSSGFGERKDPFTGKKEFHPGLDISVPKGSNVMATADGIVVFTKDKFIPYKGYGKFIIIDHGYGYKTLYGHLSKIIVRKGQHVKRGQIIALSGNTGKSTSPHIHYEVMSYGKPQNPINFILD